MIMKKDHLILLLLITFFAGFASGSVITVYKINKLKELETASEVGPSTSTLMERMQEAIRSKENELIAAVEQDPSDVSALQDLGDFYLDVGNNRKAIKIYQKILSLDPRNPDVLTDLGVAYKRIGEPKKAAESFLKASAIKPDHKEALFNLGLVLKNDLKDVSGAVKAWEKFLAVSPDDVHAPLIRDWIKKNKAGSSPGGARK